jgi:hypothetical protein
MSSPFFKHITAVCRFSPVTVTLKMYACNAKTGVRIFLGVLLLHPPPSFYNIGGGYSPYSCIIYIFFTTVTKDNIYIKKPVNIDYYCTPPSVKNL